MNIQITRKASLTFLAAILIVAAAGGSAFSHFRPGSGYRLALANYLVDFPDVDDLAARNIDFETDLYGFRYSGSSGNLVDSHILYYGAWEKHILHFMRDVVEDVYSSDAVFVDVGANTGQHSLFMSKYAREVHAIEPYPPVLLKLRSNIERNQVANIVVHPVGFGSENAELPFFSPPDWNLGTGSFVEEFKGSNQDKGLTLPIVIADEYLEESSVAAVQVMKIDIEGYEKPALAGLHNTLNRDRPVVIMELTVDPEQKALFGGEEELKQAFPMNYRFLTFAKKDRFTGAYELTELRIDWDHKAQSDIVACPQEKLELLPLQSRSPD